MTLRAMEASRGKAYLKRLLLPRGKAPRTIRRGLLAGLSMHIDFASQTQRWLGLQEREIFGWLRRFSQGIRTAIDVGANEGMYTLYFLAKTSARKVLAFEPSMEQLDQLASNLELNGLAKDGRLRIVTKKVGAVSTEDSTTLDSFSELIAPPCLVKVDIDGGEVELLRGAQTSLLQSQTRWIIEVHSKELEDGCLQILREAKYRTLVVPNAWWRLFLSELRPGELNHWLVAIPQGAAECVRTG